MSHCTRRAWARSSVAGALFGGALLAGCGPRGKAAPAVRHGVIAVSVALDVYALQNDGTAASRNRLYRSILNRFEETHQGIRVNLTSFLPTQSNMAAILAGTAPDVFPDCCVYGNYVQGGLLLDLAPFLKRDNVNPSIWSPGQVHTFDTGSGVFALSRNVDAYAFAVRLDTFDQAGIGYPHPNWTYQEFTRLAAALTHKGAAGSPTRYGAGFQNGMGDLMQILPGFGGRTTNPGRTHQQLSTPAGVAAANWLLGELIYPGVATFATSWSGNGGANLGNGRLVLQEFQINQLLPSYTAWGSSFPWVFYPPPRFPHGRANPVSNDFWAVSGSTRQPDAAWSLIYWLSAGTTFQKFMMKTFLFSPALNALWSEWIATVEATVPGLKGRHLEYFAEAAQKGWGTPQPWFRFGSTQALAADGAWWGKLLARSVPIGTGLSQMDSQVNAIVAAARQVPVPSLKSRTQAASTARRRLDRMLTAT